LEDSGGHKPQQRLAAHAQTRCASVRSRPETLAFCLGGLYRLAYSKSTLSPIMSKGHYPPSIAREGVQKTGWELAGLRPAPPQSRGEAVRAYLCRTWVPKESRKAWGHM